VKPEIVPPIIEITLSEIALKIGKYALIWIGIIGCCFIVPALVSFSQPLAALLAASIESTEFTLTIIGALLTLLGELVMGYTLISEVQADGFIND